MAGQFKINEITKQGTVVTVVLADRKKPITIDIGKSSIISYSGKSVKNFPAGIYDTSAIRNNTLSNIMFRCMEFRTTPDVCFLLKKVELFANNPELLVNVAPSSIAKECPKGFIQWLKDTGKSATQGSLTEYKESKKAGKLKKEEQEAYNLLFGDNSPMRNTGYLTKCRTAYLEMTEEIRTKFVKILKVSMKSLSWHLLTDLENFYDKLIFDSGWKEYDGVYRPENWVELLNVDRTFAWNLKNIEAIAEKAKGVKIIEKEDKIREIEKLSNEVFTVIVPKTLEDFTKEGEMQHNCVGYYYHTSIASGTNLIYFIRHTTNPDKSYITNRYHIGAHRTVETRCIFNESNNDEKALELIKKIDETINRILSNE